MNCIYQKYQEIGKLQGVKTVFECYKKLTGLWQELSSFEILSLIVQFDCPKVAKESTEEIRKEAYPKG